MTTVDHAYQEFRAAGWVDEDNNFYDAVQQAICEDVIELLEKFSNQGHSGQTAQYAINLFTTLAKFQPIVPLTGEDWEWVDQSEFWGSPHYQNKRASHVFKDEAGNAYDIQGIVFWEWSTSPDIDDGKPYKVYFTNNECSVPVTFPYTPSIEYRQWQGESNV